ncbi:hypothetical protein [Pseudonocardia endophytica]|uniref:hypothetical protein n=1 Tax=Pseudonocardia endophytica TaxID=401976 RepID=UPI0026AE5FF1
MDYVRPGDLVVVTELSRLGRSLSDVDQARQARLLLNRPVASIARLLGGAAYDAVQARSRITP